MRTQILRLSTFLFGLSSYYGQTVVKGRVLSEDGDALNGVEVYNITRKIETKTSSNGSFSIEGQADDDVRFVRKGYERLDIRLQQSNLIQETTFILKPYYTPIEEVKIGYKLTGNIKRDSEHFGDSKEVSAIKIDLGKYIIKKSHPSVTARTPDQFVQPSGEGFNNGEGAYKWDELMLAQALVEALTKEYFLTQLNLKPTQIDPFINFVLVGYERKYILKYGVLSSHDLMRFVTKADQDLEKFFESTESISK